jgi:hypothetical protein
MTEKKQLDLIFNEMLVVFKYLMFIYIKAHHPERLATFCQSAGLSNETIEELNTHFVNLIPEMKEKQVCIGRALLHVQLMTSCFPELENGFMDRLFKKFDCDEIVN